MREKNLPMLTPLTGSALLNNAGAAAQSATSAPLRKTGWRVRCALR